MEKGGWVRIIASPIGAGNPQWRDLWKEWFSGGEAEG